MQALFSKSFQPLQINDRVHMRISQENFTVKGLLSLSSLLQYTQAGTKGESPDTGVQGGEGARLSGNANESHLR